MSEQLAIKGLRLGGLLMAAGILGLFLGMALFPESNLLGGFALVFGPLLFVGMAVVAVSAVGGIVAYFRRPPAGDEAKGD